MFNEWNLKLDAACLRSESRSLTLIFGGESFVKNFEKKMIIHKPLPKIKTV